MKIMFTILAFAAASFALPAPVALAHHSAAMFDASRPIELTGTVKEFQWTNPHSWIQVIAMDAKGLATEWSIECGSPNTLSRDGWKQSSIKPGDRVILTINPMKDGSPGGLLVRAKLPNGTVLGKPDDAKPTTY